jgi:hypothetical protein
MMRIRSITGLASALFLLLVVTVGCPDGTGNKPTARLQGKVTLGGKEIPADAAARINFMPTGVDQARGTSADIKDGTYEVADAPTGKVLVSFEIRQPTGEVKSFDGVARPEPVMRNLVPESKASGMEVEIGGDKPDLNFDL